MVSTENDWKMVQKMILKLTLEDDTLKAIYSFMSNDFISPASYLSPSVSLSIV